MQKYVWCEDRGSGFYFWVNLFQVISPEVIVSSKDNNTKLRQAVEGINDDGNQYYIFVDNAIDNPDVLRETKKLRSISANKKNVSVIGIHSFEFVLLSFTELENWIFDDVDELREKRKDILYWKDVFVKSYINDTDAQMLDIIKDELKYSDKYNSEQLAARFLLDITRNTGFETKKGKLGSCFIVNCCEWSQRQLDDICGLDKNKLSRTDKMWRIYKNSVLKSALKNMGI